MTSLFKRRALQNVADVSRRIKAEREQEYAEAIKHADERKNFTKNADRKRELTRKEQDDERKHFEENAAHKDAMKKLELEYYKKREFVPSHSEMRERAAKAEAQAAYTKGLERLAERLDGLKEAHERGVERMTSAIVDSVPDDVRAVKDAKAAAKAEAKAKEDAKERYERDWELTDERQKAVVNEIDSKRQAHKAAKKREREEGVNRVRAALERDKMSTKTHASIYDGSRYSEPEVVDSLTADFLADFAELEALQWEQRAAGKPTPYTKLNKTAVKTWVYNKFEQKISAKEQAALEKLIWADMQKRKADEEDREYEILERQAARKGRKKAEAGVGVAADTSSPAKKVTPSKKAKTPAKKHRG